MVVAGRGAAIRAVATSYDSTRIPEAGGNAGLTVSAETGLAECFRSFGALPGAVVDERADLLRARTGFALTFLNGVARTRFGDYADARVKETIAWFGAHGVAFRWWLLPSNQPRDLIAILAANRMRHVYYATAMVADLETAPPPREVAGLSCTRVRDAETLTIWLDVFCRGFNIPDAGRKVWGDVFTLLGFGPNAIWRQYLGTLDGVPVATSALCVGETVAGVYHVVTSPEARGRGVGAAITAAAMNDARAAGRSIVTLQASEMAVSVYRSLGFIDCGDLELYDWRPEY